MTIASAERQKQARAGSRPDPFALIASIASARAEPRARCEAFAGALADHFGSPIASVTISSGGEQLTHVETDQSEHAESWSRVLDEAMLRAQSLGRGMARLYASNAGERGAGTLALAMICAPLTLASGDAIGAAGVVIECRSRQEAGEALTELRSLCAHLARVSVLPRITPLDETSPEDLARVFSRAGEFRSLRHFAFAVTNTLASRLACEQVSLGWVRAGHRLRVLSVSGHDNVKERNPGMHRVRQAMEECLDACEAIVAQRQDHWQEGGRQARFRLHEAWRNAAGGASVACVPILAGDRPVAILAMRRAPEQCFTPEDIDLARRLVSPLGGAMPLVERSTRAPSAALAIAIAQSIRSLLTTAGIGRKMLALALLALAAWFCFGTAPYRVTVPAVVKSERTAIASIPFDGPLADVLVRPGDVVEAGDVLALMDTRALELERGELLAQERADQLEVRQASGGGDHVAAAQAAARLDLTRARLALVDDRIARATIRAGIAGVVLGPSARDRAGEVLALGTPLLSIAARGTMRVELLVPERRAPDVDLGAAVAFAANAQPEATLRTIVELRPPSTQLRAGRSVLVGESSLPSAPAWLTPGMEGVASIDAGERPVWWIALHRVIDYAHLELMSP